MKIQINLLPESRKVLARKKKIFRNIIEQEILFVFPVVVFILMLVGINFILNFQNDSVDLLNKSLDDQGDYKELKTYEEEAQSINAKVSEIRKIKEASLKWSGAISEFVNILPSGISVSDFSTTDYKITVIGKAVKRESLINFQNNISGSQCFENANVPLSNLVVKDNIDFQMDFDVKRECLLKK